jgi:hypothetical protein
MLVELSNKEIEQIINGLDIARGECNSYQEIFKNFENKFKEYLVKDGCIYKHKDDKETIKKFKDIKNKCRICKHCIDLEYTEKIDSGYEEYRYEFLCNLNKEFENRLKNKDYKYSEYILMKEYSKNIFGDTDESCDKFECSNRLFPTKYHLQGCSKIIKYYE